MKQLFIVVISLLLGIYQGNAQEPCGLYTTPGDLKNDHLSIRADLSAGRHAIVVSDFFMRPYICIRTNGHKLRIPMDSVYALKQYNGDIYRIWHQKSYRLVDTGPLLVFSYDKRVIKMACTARSSHPVAVLQKEYYFCCDYSDSLLLLNTDNVRLALHADKQLNDALQLSFPHQQMLVGTDNKKHSGINTFLINYKKENR